MHNLLIIFVKLLKVLSSIIKGLLLKQKSTAYKGIPDMWHLYDKYWLPFG